MREKFLFHKYKTAKRFACQTHPRPFSIPARCGLVIRPGKEGRNGEKFLFHKYKTGQRFAIQTHPQRRKERL